MAIEHEMKVLDIDVDSLKERLLSVGAKHVLDREMKRKTYDIDEGMEHKWMRLRDDGQHVTLTIKEIEHSGVDGTKEWEVKVSSFDGTAQILELLGYRHKHYQENKRSSYSLDGIDVEIDSWPGIPTYLELEGPSEEAIRKTAEILGILQERLTTLDTMSIYDHYSIDIRNIPILTFSSPPASR